MKLFMRELLCAIFGHRWVLRSMLGENSSGVCVEQMCERCGCQCIVRI